MELFKNKYNNLYNDIFKEKENQKICPKVEEKIDDYPEPSKYRISTMTMITSFNCNINFSNFFCFLK